MGLTELLGGWADYFGSLPAWSRTTILIVGGLVLTLAGGAVTAIQRFGSALNTNVHSHTLVAQGVFVERPEGRLREAYRICS